MLRELFISADARHEFILEPETSHRLICILVHGTFAPNAAWTLPGSSLRQCLQQNLSEHGPIRFCRFVWRGRWRNGLNNCHRDRLEAGKILATHLEKLATEIPDVPIVLIGHSHGGCVILYALKRVEHWPASLAVVTMGTPFFNFRPRKLAAVLQPMELYFGLVSTIVFLFGGPYFLSIMGSQHFGRDFCLMFGLLIAGRFALSPLIRRFHRNAARLTSRWKRRMAEITTFGSGIPIFSAHTHRDEAWHWLLLGGFIPKLPLVLLFPVGILANPIIGLPLMLVLGPLGAFPVFVGLVVGTLVYPAIGILSWLTRKQPLFFGETLPDLIAGEVKISRSPIGSGNLVLAKAYRSETCLAHSIYEFKNFREEMVVWLRERLSSRK